MGKSGNWRRLTRIIRDATQTKRTDLAKYALRLRVRSREPRWPHPVFKLADVDSLRRAIRAARHDLGAFNDQWLKEPPYRLSDPKAATDAIAGLARADALILEVKKLADERRRELEEFEGRRLTRRRDWRAYMTALEAARIFEELTGNLPDYSKSKRDPFRVMIHNVFDELDIRVRDVEEIIKWALKTDEGKSD